jgi:hypothetical protein
MSLTSNGERACNRFIQLYSLAQKQSLRYSNSRVLIAGALCFGLKMAVVAARQAQLAFYAFAKPQWSRFLNVQTRQHLTGAIVLTLKWQLS